MYLIATSSRTAVSLQASPKCAAVCALLTDSSRATRAFRLPFLTVVLHLERRLEALDQAQKSVSLVGGEPLVRHRECMGRSPAPCWSARDTLKKSSL